MLDNFVMHKCPCWIHTCLDGIAKPVIIINMVNLVKILEARKNNYATCPAGALWIFFYAVLFQVSGVWNYQAWLYTNVSSFILKSCYETVPLLIFHSPEHYRWINQHFQKMVLLQFIVAVIFTKNPLMTSHNVCKAITSVSLYHHWMILGKYRKQHIWRRWVISE